MSAEKNGSKGRYIAVVGGTWLASYGQERITYSCIFIDCSNEYKGTILERYKQVKVIK